MIAGLRSAHHGKKEQARSGSFVQAQRRRFAWSLVHFRWGNGITDRESYDAALNSYRIWQGEQAQQQLEQSRGPLPLQLVQGGQVTISSATV